MDKKIKGLLSFCSNKEYNNFIYPKSLINVGNVKKKEIFLKLLPIEELATQLHIDTKMVLKTIDKMMNKQIVLCDLLSYNYTPTGTTNEYGILVAEKCAISSTYSNSKRSFIEKYYDVYLVRNENFRVTFNLIFRTLLSEIFPKLFIKNEENGFLFKEDFKYTSEQRKCLENLSSELALYKMPYEINHLPIKDIARCLNNKKRINDIIYKTRISCFFESDCIYIYLFDVNINGYSYKRSLYVPLEALFTKDYDLIANKFVSSQAILNENGEREFINGSQKDMPYFNNERTQKILTYILK